MPVCCSRDEKSSRKKDLYDKLSGLLCWCSLQVWLHYKPSFIHLGHNWMKKEEKYEGPKSTNVFPIQLLNEHAEHLEHVHTHGSASSPAAASCDEVRPVFVQEKQLRATKAAVTGSWTWTPAWNGIEAGSWGYGVTSKWSFWTVRFILLLSWAAFLEMLPTCGGEQDEQDFELLHRLFLTWSELLSGDSTDQLMERRVILQGFSLGKTGSLREFQTRGPLIRWRITNMCKTKAAQGRPPPHRWQQRSRWDRLI